jgi:hypothetical protein
MKSLGVALALSATLVGVAAADEPARRAMKIEVVAYGTPDVGGITVVPCDEDGRGWHVRDPFELPFARVRGVSVEPPSGGKGDGRVRVMFSAKGDMDPERRFLVELWVMGTAGRVLWHTWELQGDARLNKPIQMGSRIATPSLENSASFRVPHRLVPQVRSVKVQLRAMAPREWKHFPPTPSEINLTMTRPDKDGNFVLSFVNPEDWDDETPGRRVSVSLWVGDDEAKKSVRFADVKPGTEYRFAFRLEPKDLDRAELHVAFFARQPENAEFAKQAFVVGTGSAYRGPWYGVKVPLREVAREE